MSMKQRTNMKVAKTHNFIEVTKKEFQQYQVEAISDKQAYEIQNNLFGVVDCGILVMEIGKG